MVIPFVILPSHQFGLTLLQQYGEYFGWNWIVMPQPQNPDNAMLNDIEQ